MKRLFAGSLEIVVHVEDEKGGISCSAIMMSLAENVT